MRTNRTKHPLQTSLPRLILAFVLLSTGGATWADPSDSSREVGGLERLLLVAHGDPDTLAQCLQAADQCFWQCEEEGRDIENGADYTDWRNHCRDACQEARDACYND